jgi:hypothetical protein
MEMRVVLADRARVTALTERLRAAVGPERVSVNGDGREIDIRVDPETDPSLLRVVDTVERWQHDEAGMGPVEMWLGERSYVFRQQVPSVQTWQ